MSNQTQGRVARIFQEPTGQWHISDDALGYLDAQGRAYKSRAAAIRSLRETDEPEPYTHYLSRSGRKVRL